MNNATQLGISSIDTAPSYGNSEHILGKCLRETSKFRISTKVGKAGAFRLTGKMVLESIEKSLKAFNLENIEYIYLHSVDFKFVEESAIDEMINLKKLVLLTRLEFHVTEMPFQIFMNWEFLMDF